jgi:hypothetical protein
MKEKLVGLADVAGKLESNDKVILLFHELSSPRSRLTSSSSSKLQNNKTCQTKRLAVFMITKGFLPVQQAFALILKRRVVNSVMLTKNR